MMQNTDYSYDLVGNLTSLTDPGQNTTTWLYDGLDRVKEEINELGLSRHYRYDAAGNLVGKTDRNNRVTEYGYDHLHRMTEERWLESGVPVRTFSYAFDLAGRLTAADDPSGAVTFQYDALDRRIASTQTISGLSQTIQSQQSFDAVGNRLSFTVSVNGVENFTNTYEYDDLHRLTRITQDSPEITSTYTPASVRTVDLAYNAAGQFTRIERRGESLAMVSTDYEYDGAGRLVRMDHDVDIEPYYSGYHRRSWRWRIDVITQRIKNRKNS